MKRKMEIWNKDHSLGSGLRNSVVWYYQVMACDIGESQMEEWILQISYGNQDISLGLNQFILPIEQVDFMGNLYGENLFLIRV